MNIIQCVISNSELTLGSLLNDLEKGRVNKTLTGDAINAIGAIRAISAIGST